MITDSSITISLQFYCRMTNDYTGVWDLCLHTIKKSINDQNFKTWFEPIRPVKLESHSLTIQVPNKFFYEWLEEHYVSLLKKTIRDTLGDKGRLEYQILNGAAAAVKNAGNKGLHTARSKNDEVIALPTMTNIDAQSIKNPFVIPGIQKIKIDPQLNANATFSNFIEGDCNRLARTAGMAVANKPGGTAFNPLFIFGATGLGKTHLAQAIGNDIVKKNPSKNIIYVTCEKFGNQIIQAIKTNAVNDLVNFYQMIDVLIVDDVQFLSGKPKTQEIFFNIFNQLHQTGKQLVFTSDKAPKDLEGMEDRLISRFKWGLSADLSMPDLETRMAIVESKLNLQGVFIAPEIIEYICYNIKTSVRELEGVLVSLIAQSMINRKEIDMELAKSIIKNYVQNAYKEITVEYLKDIVAQQYGIPVEHLSAASRKRQIVEARQLAMFLAKHHTKTSLKAIGEKFGGRDHSTVIHSCKTVQDLLDTDEKFKEILLELEKTISMNA